MNQHYTNYLFKKYEPLYSGHKESITQNLMPFGFEHGDGWFNIINVLSYNLSHDWLWAKKDFDIIKGRAGQLIYPKGKQTKHNTIITAESIELAEWKMQQAVLKVPKVFQVKEKFGTLRYYVNSTTKEQDSMIRMAEGMSEVTCEVCGKPGKINTYGWINVRCKEHRT